MAEVVARGTPPVDAGRVRDWLRAFARIGYSADGGMRRLAFSRLRDSEIVAKLFDTIGPRFKARPGGYTRILHMAPRPGDNAPMALMQLVERSAPVAVEAAPEDKKANKADKPAAPSKEEKKAKAEAKKGREKAAKEAKAAKAVEKKAAKKSGTVAKKKKAAPKKKKSSK